MIAFGCVISAAGRGERLGGPMPKALQRIGAVPMLTHATEAIAAHPAVTAIVIAAPPDRVDAARAAVSQVDHPDIRVVAGGGSRTDSVRAAVSVLPMELTGILVHDAARPFVPGQVIESVIAGIAAGADAVVPGIPVVDTIKQVDADDVVVATPVRASLRAIQTPQGFRADLLRRALAQHDQGATDDAQLVERVGGVVRVVPGHPDSLKITTPEDIERAEAILRRRTDHVH